MSDTRDVVYQSIPEAISVSIDPTPIVLSPSTHMAIEDHWNRLMASGKTFTRGITYTVTSMTQEAGGLRVTVQPTDYAHYLATVHGVIDRERCRVIHSTGAVITANSHVLVGKMESWTAWAGRWQLCGGGLSAEDSDGLHIDLERSLLRELREELGLTQDDVKAITPLWLKSGGPWNFLVVVYGVWIRASHEEFLQRYTHFAKATSQQGELPEFSEVYPVFLDAATIQQWLSLTSRDPMVDYLSGILQRLPGKA